MLDLFYRFGSSPNWDGYCNLEVDKVVERQSTESDIEKRKRLVWEIERKLAEDGARPIIFYNRFAIFLQGFALKRLYCAYTARAADGGSICAFR